jgi:hypothetical protein
MATEYRKDETSEAMLKVAKGNVQFTTSVYKVIDSCLNDGNVEGCSKPCTYVLSRIYTFMYFIVDNIVVYLIMFQKTILYFFLSCY